MLRQFRPLLMRCALACAGLAAMPAMAAPPFGAHPGPRVIMAPRYVPNIPRQFRPARQAVRQDHFDKRFDRRRLRDRSLLIGVDSGVNEVPVPAGIDAGEPPQIYPPQAYPPQAYPQDIEFENGYGARPPANVGPQIITLPDAPRGRGRGLPGSDLRGSDLRQAAPAPSWRSATAPPLRQWRAPRFVHQRRALPWYEQGQPSYDYRPSPVALAPCGEGSSSYNMPIYNTPCGVRPYD
ncbi:hypothetical protein SAMN05444161_5148 [Rhizobiales bacterium GAS191]|nr:hypothetical protein SAMN05519103_04413 [Rhizobiales bacterium GAS113]SEE21446.1 hypothetical protein SAMN05444161_5148 [Rhizobiales bacterium GAS191]